MTVSDTITRAVQMTGVRGFGQVPSADEQNSALVVFQNMLMGLPRTVLSDVTITTNYTAGENERITDTSGTATITRPTTVTDIKTGLTRVPKNGAVIEVASATVPTRHIYIVEKQAWIQVNGLTLAADQPFGTEHEEGLAAMLAARLYPMLQQDQTRQPSAVVLQLASQGRQAIRQRFKQPYIATTDPLLLNRFQRFGCNV